MKKSVFIYFLSAILTFGILLCGVEGKEYVISTPFENSNTQTETRASAGTEPTSSKSESSDTTAASENTAEIIGSEDVEISAGESVILTLHGSSSELESFESDNEAVAAVDSGGRLDALKEGSAIITASYSGGRLYCYNITVGNAEEEIEYDGYSTCILDNLDILGANKADNSGRNMYYIKVNRRQNCVTVYTYDSSGNYTVPVRAMVCSCGTNNATVTGSFSLYFKNEWNGLYNGVYGHYVSGIYGDFLFHSVPYYSTSPSELETEEFNKLGESASLGCVRMSTADTRWIYENCKVGTTIEIYDDDNPGPLGKPESIKISDLTNGWDPTDKNTNNPYNKLKPTITGADDVTISQGEDFDILEGVYALDTCSNDITDKLTAIGNVISSNKGVYKITYSITDAMHRTTTTDRYVTVK